MSEHEMEGMKLLLLLLFSVSGNLSRYEHVIELSDFGLEIFIFFIQDDPEQSQICHLLLNQKKRIFYFNTRSKTGCAKLHNVSSSPK